MLIERTLLCKNGWEIPCSQLTGAGNAKMAHSFQYIQTDLLRLILCYAWCHVDVKLGVGKDVHVAKLAWIVQPCVQHALDITAQMHAHLMITTVTMKQVKWNTWYMYMFYLHLSILPFKTCHILSHMYVWY